MSFYMTSTVDNLIATSSPIQESDENITVSTLASEAAYFTKMITCIYFFQSMTYQPLFCISSTQAVVSNPRPGDEPEVVELHGRAFSEIVGPILASQLGDRKYMHGHSFSAVDVIVGFCSPE